MIHQLKILQQYYDGVASGDKTFEIRKNDRGFAKGDTLLLSVWNEELKAFTGDQIQREVTWVLYDHKGLRVGFVILGLGIIDAD